MRPLLHRGSAGTYSDSKPRFTFWLQKCIVGAPAVSRDLRFLLNFISFVQSSGILGQSQTNVVGLYTSIVLTPSHLSPDLTSLDRQWPRFFP